MRTLRHSLCILLSQIDFFDFELDLGNVLDNFFQEEAIHSELKWSQIQEEMSETVEIVDVFDCFSLTLQLEQLLPLKGVSLQRRLLG